MGLGLPTNWSMGVILGKHVIRDGLVFVAPILRGPAQAKDGRQVFCLGLWFRVQVRSTPPIAVALDME